MRGAVVLASFLMLASGCGSDEPERIEVHVGAADKPNIDRFARWVPHDGLVVLEADDPEGAATSGSGLQIGVVVDASSCSECYRIDRSGGALIVRGGAPLGIQYGLAHAFELMSFRFYSPWYTHVPDDPAMPDAGHPELGVDMAPDKARRGLHLHTIHPIEAYYAFWEPGEQRLEDAKRIADWAIKNRANYIQWVALDNVQADPAAAPAWRQHTISITDYLRARGLGTGVAIQLFGQSNLQQGFDLVDSEDGSIPPRTEIESRLPLILQGAPFDNINLSFGEFFGADPAVFVDTLNLAYTIQQEQQPGMEMTTTIHVGNSPDLRVDYMGQSLLYYFLVKFADSNLVPWIHTVMFYNLFEDAGGAYQHDEFDEHRAYLFERLTAGQKVGYFPETAYWVAFDNSVPVYLPLYVRSRWLDLRRIRDESITRGIADLDDHTLFSSGWEWGYWQNDYAALRAGYTLAPSWESYFEQMYAPFGAAGAEAAQLVVELATAQHTYLLEQRLMAYFAGRDLYIDLGRELDIISQPDRPLFDEVLAMDATARASFVSTVLDPLETFNAELDRIAAELEALAVSRDPRWHRELVDGAAVTAARGRYIHALFRAVVAHAETGSDDGWLAKAQTTFEQGRAIVDRRHADLEYPHADELLYGTTNATFYQWGYLKQTHELCYWTRERVEVARAIEGSTETLPSCVF